MKLKIEFQKYKLTFIYPLIVMVFILCYYFIYKQELDSNLEIMIQVLIPVGLGVLTYLTYNSSLLFGLLWLLPCLLEAVVFLLPGTKSNDLMLVIALYYCAGFLFVWLLTLLLKAVIHHELFTVIISGVVGLIYYNVELSVFQTVTDRIGFQFKIGMMLLIQIIIFVLTIIFLTKLNKQSVKKALSSKN